MRIRYLKLSNFRSVASGEVLFPVHTVIIGSNSVGKSTICEALDLLLGPDRLSRSNPIDEHDFHTRRYLDDDGNPVAINLEVVLTDLPEKILSKFRIHVEFWNTKTNSLLDETNDPEACDSEDVTYALRLKFEGIYEIEEDEFRAETYFASPPITDKAHRNRVTRAEKRQFGFIYLRALRTGSRALGLERGSLLDIILNLKDDNRHAMWEQTLTSIENLKPPVDAIPQLRDILDEVDARTRHFVRLSKDERPLRLYPSALTRESLRRSITLFGSSEQSQLPVPYWRLGSGVVNAMVFSLLTFIADLKTNVMFAMEEPELAIPPHTQRRIVQFLQRHMNQSILTTHSPFVLEQFDPSNVVLLKRQNNNSLTGHQIDLMGIKAKTYRGHMRRTFAESMLGNGVLCVEGISDQEAIYAASSVLEEHRPEHTYTPLDLSGVTVIQCEGEGFLLRYGRFFSGIGLRTYAFYDRQASHTDREAIAEVYDDAWELNHTGIENLLAKETAIDVVRAFLSEASQLSDYPTGTRFQLDPATLHDGQENEVRRLCRNILKVRKGAGYAARLVENTSVALKVIENKGLKLTVVFFSVAALWRP